MSIRRTGAQVPLQETDLMPQQVLGDRRAYRLVADAGRSSLWKAYGGQAPSGVAVDRWSEDTAVEGCWVGSGSRCRW